MRLFAVSALLVSAAFAQPYEKWLDEDVAYIVTDDEIPRRRPQSTKPKKSIIVALLMRISVSLLPFPDGRPIVDAFTSYLGHPI